MCNECATTSEEQTYSLAWDHAFAMTEQFVDVLHDHKSVLVSPDLQFLLGVFFPNVHSTDVVPVWPDKNITRVVKVNETKLKWTEIHHNS